MAYTKVRKGAVCWLIYKDETTGEWVLPPKLKDDPAQIKRYRYAPEDQIGLVLPGFFRFFLSYSYKKKRQSKRLKIILLGDRVIATSSSNCSVLDENKRKKKPTIS